MPRKITGAAFISLDGVVQGPGGPEEDTTGGFAHGGWMATVFDDEIGQQIDKLFGRPFDLLLGRRTYEIFAAHWPFQPDGDPIKEAFDKAGKYVLTGSDAPLEWQGSHRLADMDALAALKTQDGPDLVIQGSSTLYPQLLTHGLLDRLTLIMVPIVLGSGKRLFGDGTPAGKLALVEHRLTPTGTMIVTYEPAGPLETGSFAMQEPTAQELERRRRMEAGTW